MNPVTVLRAAIQRIKRPQDWCNSGWENKTGGICMVNAICAAEGATMPSSCQTMKHVYDEIGDVYAGGWNDRHSHKQVLTMLRKALRKLEAAK